MADEKEKNDLRVEDRRNFDKEGNPIRREAETAGKQRPVPQDEAKGEQDFAGSPPQIDFNSLIVLYVQTALVHLGELEEPGQNKVVMNLEAARQVIEIIDLLRVKTSGNLTPQEAQLVEKALFDLRLLYVQKAKKS
jgi:hypothetical protein